MGNTGGVSMACGTGIQISILERIWSTRLAKVTGEQIGFMLILTGQSILSIDGPCLHLHIFLPLEFDFPKRLTRIAPISVIEVSATKFTVQLSSVPAPNSDILNIGCSSYCLIVEVPI